MKKYLFHFLLCFTISIKVLSQDTFSILGFDSITGEVGGAGASCVNLFGTGFSNDFIIDLFPGIGAIASQASYVTTNQVNARNRMIFGDSPTQIISWLQSNDVANNPSIRQYGVARMDAGFPKVAAFTGTNCMNYKNHIVGPNYSIQGNILLGQKVLDSMEVRFKREKGNLACKLMAAMQGANMVGADTRCASNNSSSLFAFIKVSQPDDAFGNPSFILSLKTLPSAGIEPIDSLQKMFDAVKTCTVETVGLSYEKKESKKNCLLYPNPAKNQFTLKVFGAYKTNRLVVRNLLGLIMEELELKSEQIVNTESWPRGIYFIELYDEGSIVTKKLVLN